MIDALRARAGLARTDPLAILALLAIVALGALALAVSLRWGVRNDLPVLMYPARLAITGARVPFRDLVDMNQPFAYLAYGLLDAIVGANDRGLRILDVAIVLAIGWVASDALGARARIVGLAAAALFACWHIHDAGIDALQRELLVLALLVGSAFALRRHAPLAGGIAAGLAVLVKLHAAMLFAAVLALHLLGSPARRARVVLRYAGGGALAIAAVLSWLAAIGGLEGWLELLTGYVPLYGQQAGTLHFVSTPEARWREVLALAIDEHHHRSLVFWPLALWLALRVPRRSPWRRAALSASVLWLAGWAYVIPPGVFWFYHHIPAYFFGGACVAVLLALPRPRSIARALELVAVRGLALWIAWGAFGWPLTDTPQLDRDGRNPHARMVHAYLAAHVAPGETVQPLDVVEGAVDGMWRARVPLATPFLYDFMFYHHVDEPLIQAMRRRMIEALRGPDPPDWIVRARPGHRMRPHGARTSSRFDALDRALRERYRFVHEDEAFDYLRLRR